MNISQLTSQETSAFQDIHKFLFTKRKKVFETKALSNKDKTKNNITSIIEKATTILELFNKTNYSLDSYYIEFQHRNSGFEKKARRVFEWHEDDKATVSYNVYTVIFYIRKDNGIKKGGLEYKVNGKSHIQAINEGNILCFDGDVMHRPEICSGFGCRDTIVVFVKRK